MKLAEFEQGVLIKEHKETATSEENGTEIYFEPDETVFKHYNFISEYIENQIWNYCYLNAGLVINYQ
jgi:topoisomerase-4 subunit B